jgi:hypothetical protein
MYKQIIRVICYVLCNDILINMFVFYSKHVIVYLNTYVYWVITIILNMSKYKNNTFNHINTILLYSQNYLAHKNNITHVKSCIDQSSPHRDQ